MEHPDPRIIRDESDIVGCVRWNQDRVLPYRASCEWLPILIKDRKDVPVQVHRMIQVRLVVEMELDELPFLNHNPACIRKDLPVHRVGHTHASKRGPKLVPKHDVIRCIEMTLKCDWIRCWRSIRREIEPLRNRGKPCGHRPLTHDQGRSTHVALTIIGSHQCDGAMRGHLKVEVVALGRPYGQWRAIEPLRTIQI